MSCPYLCVGNNSNCYKLLAIARIALTVPDWQERLREFVDQLLSDFPKNE